MLSIIAIPGDQRRFPNLPWNKGVASSLPNRAKTVSISSTQSATAALLYFISMTRAKIAIEGHAVNSLEKPVMDQANNTDCGISGLRSTTLSRSQNKLMSEM